MTKRNLFAEISEGFEALADERTGKRTLHTHEVEWLPVHSIYGQLLLIFSDSHSRQD